MGQRAAYDRLDWKTPARADDLSRGILATETSRMFHDLMDAGMLTSFYKYKAVALGYPERVNAIESLKQRLDKYAQTGNAEFLVDVANFAMIEFMHPAHTEAHYTPTDAKESPGRVAAHTEIYDRPVHSANTDLADRDEKPF